MLADNKTFPSPWPLPVDTRAVPPARQTRWTLRVVVASALLSLGVVALAGAVVSRAGSPVALLKEAMLPPGVEMESSGGVPGLEFADSAALDEVDEPPEDAFATLKPAAVKFLARVGVKYEKLSDTDIDESCGTFATPCLATVGACLEKYAVEGADGKVTVGTGVCNCFATSIGDGGGITVPGLDGVDINCDFTCLESINGVFNQYLAEKNGVGGARAFCETTFSNIADQQFGTDNKVVAEEADLDSLTVMPLDNPKAARAGAVLQEYINNERRKNCPLKKKLDGEPHVTYVKVGMEAAARYAYHIEAIFGDEEEFYAHISHLPPSAQLADPITAAEDPHNYLGRFAVVAVSPEPCATGAEATLVTTFAKVQAINSQKLGWKASHRDSHHGKTAADFGMGLVKPPLDEMKRHRVSLSTAGFVPPKEFRTADRRAGQTECLAYNVLDQGSCGSCYAFAAASAFSARMCGKTDGKWNIVASPQEMMDCSNGN